MAAMRILRLGACAVLSLVNAGAGCAGGSDTTRDTAAEIGEGSDGTTGTTGAATTGTSATTSATATTSGGECVPGQQIECACPGGAPGAQACLPDGSGYEPCECPGDDAATTAVDSSGGVGESSSSDGGVPDDCASCGNAALLGECAAALDACLVDAACASMAACVQRCGLTVACVQGCQKGSPDDPSTALFTTLAECVTAACPVCLGP